ncbi:MAG: Hsp70 family protein, partial [Acidobacteriota bacterium]|nr:Hsp70 family protein [Acidobacteriota bacterium]
MPYIIGIDLGTTNSALAFTTPAAKDDVPPVQMMAVPQLVNPGEVREESLLPSFLYMPGEKDFPAGSVALPWEPEPHFVIGRLAQKRGVENAARLVTSAKSWLSHAGVDRTSAILPWQAPEGVAKLSPVDVSTQYLRYLRDAWNAKMPDAPFTDHEVLVTVPASFDAVARELTLKAAENAGYRNVTLLEEPQAAFYAWIERHRDWRERVKLGDLILVIDIGGGTTDFSLIAVTEQKGELALERVAVGEHILLGGDNMDLALARLVADRLVAKGTRIDAFQLQQLWHNCRVAKEKLLEPEAKAKEQPVSILGKGTGIVGGTIKAALHREDVDGLIGEGFFPQAASTDMPQRQRRVGLQEIGLPYAPDAAVTRHLARFLRQQSSSAEHNA